MKTTGLSALASVPLTPPPERRSLSFVFDHPFITLVILSLVILGLMTGINVLEKGPAAHAWMSHHGVALALFKGILCVFAVPGLFIMQVWVPGMKTKDLTEPGPRWIPYVIGALLIAALLYGAARIFLAAR